MDIFGTASKSMSKLEYLEEYGECEQLGIPGQETLDDKEIRWGLGEDEGEGEIEAEGK